MEVVNDDLVMITGGPLKLHEWVQVQQFMTAADEAAITNRIAKSSGQQGDKQITFTLGDVQMATAKRMIKNWNLTKEVTQHDGSKVPVPIPFSTQAIEKLSRTIYKYILKKIDELNPEEESDEDFLPGASGSSAGS